MVQQRKVIAGKESTKDMWAMASLFASRRVTMATHVTAYDVCV